jgi:hypothetical protein
MIVRHHYIQFRRGRQVFGIRRISTDGRLQFAGSVDGVDCGVWPTKEGAVRGLLRRAATAVPY